MVVHWMGSEWMDGAMDERCIGGGLTKWLRITKCQH